MILRRRFATGHRLPLAFCTHSSLLSLGTAGATYTLPSSHQRRTHVSADVAVAEETTGSSEAGSRLLSTLLQTTSCVPKELHSIICALPEEALEELIQRKQSLKEFLKERSDLFQLQQDTHGLIAVTQPTKEVTAEEQGLKEALISTLVPKDKHRSIAEIYLQLTDSQREVVRWYSNLERFLRRFPEQFSVSQKGTHVIQKDSHGQAPVFYLDAIQIAQEEDRFAMVAEGDAGFEVESVAYGTLPPAPKPPPTSYSSLADPSESVSYDFATRDVMDAMLAVLPPYFVPLVEVEQWLSSAKVEASITTLGNSSVSILPSTEGQEGLAEPAQYVVSAHVAALVKGGKLFQSLEPISGNDLDIRVIGDQKSDIFVRLIASSFPTSQHEMGTEIFGKYDPIPLAKALHNAVGQSRGHEWVSIEELPSVLEASGTGLLAKLPLQGPAAILLFDRLTYLFDVDTEQYRIRCRDNRQRLNFNFRTTPTPRAVRFVLQMVRGPTPLNFAQQHLPPVIVKEVSSVFPSFSHFVGAHRLYMFLREDEMLWTSRLMHQQLLGGQRRHERQMGEVPRGGPPVSPAQIKSEILSILPREGAVGWQKASKWLSFEVRNAIPLRSAREFIQRIVPEAKVYDVLGTNRWVLQRATLPPPTNAAPSIHSEREMIEYLIDLTAPHNGTTFATYVALMARLSQQAKAWISQNGYFSVLHFVEKHKNIWEVRRPPGGEKQNALIQCLVPASSNAVKYAAAPTDPPTFDGPPPFIRGGRGRGRGMDRGGGYRGRGRGGPPTGGPGGSFGGPRGGGGGPRGRGGPPGGGRGGRGRGYR